MEKNYDLERRFGSKMAYIRKSKKISQMKLAELIDMNFNYISQIECGKSNITIKTIKKIANALDVDVKELFEFSF